MSQVLSSKFAFIFDLDGTLVDSFSDIYRCLNETSLNFGLPEFNLKRTWNSFGEPLPKILSVNRVPLELVEAFSVTFRKKLQIQILKETILFDGALSLITKIHSLGYRLGIATSKPTQLAKLTISNSPLRVFPFEIVGGEALPPKPDPATLFEVMKSLKVSSGIIIGDRVEDVQAGKCADIYTCAVLQSSHTSKQFRALNPDFIFGSLTEIDINFGDILRLIKIGNHEQIL